MRILFLVSLLLATVADAQLVIESNGNHLFPDRLATGPTEFDQLDTDDIMARDGTLVYCENCPPGAPPASACTIGSQNCGAYCFRIEGVWVCSTEATCTAVGQDCVMDHECCAGVCTSGMCTIPISPTMCAPFICPMGSEQIGADSNCNPICGLEAGGSGCTGTITTPLLEQRAVRTVTGTCSANFLPFCDVRNYGAVGDGVTNDAAAFVAAITACCNAGTVYVPRSTNPYLVQSALNADFSCTFNLVGDGPNASAVKTTTNFGNCFDYSSDAAFGPNHVQECDALVTTTADVRDITLEGPNGVGSVTPGTAPSTSDGIAFPTNVKNVSLFGFNVAIDSPSGIVSDTGIQAGGVGILKGGDMYRVSISSQAFAGLLDKQTGGTPQTWEDVSIGSAPYLIFGRSFAPHTRMPIGSFGSYGNAGIYCPTCLLEDIEARFNLPSQNSGSKIAAVAIDKALHLGDVEGKNRFWAAIPQSSADCQFGGVFGGILWEDSAAEENTTGFYAPTSCTTSSGTPEKILFCSENLAQCQPNGGIPTVSVGGGSTLNIGSNAREYFVSAGTVNVIDSTGVNQCLTAGQRVTFISTGVVVYVNESSGVPACAQMRLNGAANFTTATGNTITFLHDGSRWREISRSTAQ